MSIKVQLTYDMARKIGENPFEIASGADTVADVFRLVEERFKNEGHDFEKLVRVAAVAVNGVLVHRLKGMQTPLRAGDRISFVKAAAGG
jgi:molybdopterin converting factor small subunit